MLTREQINSMDATELSLAVAEHIFQAKVIGNSQYPDAKLLVGWFGENAWKPMRGTWHSAQWKQSEESAWEDCPNYAEDISAAMEVANAVKDKVKAHIEIELFYDSRVDGRVSITDREEEDIILPYGKDQKAGLPKTLPEAICKAALLAVIES